MNEKFEDYTGLLEKYNVNSIRQLDNMITSIEKENKRLHKYLNMQTMALCDFHNRETAQMKWGDKRPEFNLDKYYEVCMEESQQIYYKNDVHKRINELIIECEKGIEEIINGEKDSYIVKHDIAIKMLKKLYENLEEENSKMNREKVELNEIIGIVKTDTPTNSVELKKEMYNDTLNKLDKNCEDLKKRVFYEIDRRINTLKANSSQCHQAGSHDKGIEFTLQAELLERLKSDIEQCFL